MRNFESIKVPIKWLIIMVSLVTYFHSSKQTSRILDYTRHKLQFQSVWLFHSFIDSFKACATFMHVVRPIELHAYEMMKSIPKRVQFVNLCEKKIVFGFISTFQCICGLEESRLFPGFSFCIDIWCF